MSTPQTDVPSPRFNLYRDAQRRLVLVDSQGREHVGVEPVRCFPVSHPGQWISICDAEGHELTCVPQVGTLPSEVRRLLEEELAGHEFVPIVTRIAEVVEDSDGWRWEIETDRGPIRIQTSDETAVRRLDERRAMILDMGGIRYLIPDIAALDRSSRRRLEQYL